MCAGSALHHHDHAGIGTLEFSAATDHQAHPDNSADVTRCALWRYTLGRHRDAQRFEQAFNRQVASIASGRPAVPADEEETATDFAPQRSAPPLTWTLLRLWRFARPYQGMLLAGFLPTLVATAATLAPPYLTMPLMDDVLIPWQNGTPVDWTKVTWLLGGLFGAAILAWGLGWARTYILALVSERIGADLRTTTHEHLLKLFIEYFGGKRTGDLLARIGSETDRINVFLSLHLLDFATDVLMIAMTAVILFSINPWLALATLLPLPIIAWLTHMVRDRLRNGFEQIDRGWAEVTSVLVDTIPGIRVVKAFGRLVFVTAAGITHEGVVPVRAFALTAPDEGIALLSSEGRELAWIERFADLPPAQRALIEEELAQRDFMPAIERILSVNSYATPSTWQVETDRGATQLLLKSEDDIRRLKSPGALLIADGNGIHYLIRGRRMLDVGSQKILKRF